MDRSNVEDPKKWIKKSAKRDHPLIGRPSDLRFNNQNKFYGIRRFPDHRVDRTPTIKAIEVTPPKLMGHYQTDRFGKNLVLDGPGGIRVYNLPVKRIGIVAQSNDLEIAEAVDDSDQFVENESCATYIPDCYNLNFDLLNGYIPLKDGGNSVSLSGLSLDRTAGMRWMVENHQKIKCNDGSRLFDIDFYAGNGALQFLMASQFFKKDDKKAHIAVILFKGTYFMFIIDLRNEDKNEVSNKLSFGGIRFEDYITRGLNGEQCEPSSGMHNNYADFIKYNNVVRFKFHNFKMLVTGNVDSVIPGSSTAIGRKPKADDFVEIKTSAPLEDKYDHSRMGEAFCCNKSSSWFAQCVLMGVKHVVVGIREQRESFKKIAVKKTRAFTLEELQRHSNGWSKDQCFQDLKKFLCVVKDKVVVDDPEIINIFEVQDGWIRGPDKKTYADDCVRFPNISEVVELMNRL